MEVEVRQTDYDAGERRTVPNYEYNKSNILNLYAHHIRNIGLENLMHFADIRILIRIPDCSLLVIQLCEERLLCSTVTLKVVIIRRRAVNTAGIECGAT